MAHAGQIISNPVSGERIDLPRHLRRHGRRAARVRARALARRSCSRRARAPGAGGAIRGARGDDEVPARPADHRGRGGRCGHRSRGPGAPVRQRRRRAVPRARAGHARTRHGAALRDDRRARRRGQRDRRTGMPKPLDLALFVGRFRREVRAPFPPRPSSAPSWPRSPPSPVAAATASATASRPVGTASPRCRWAGTRSPRTERRPAPPRACSGLEQALGHVAPRPHPARHREHRARGVLDVLVQRVVRAQPLLDARRTALRGSRWKAMKNRPASSWPSSVSKPSVNE